MYCPDSGIYLKDLKTTAGLISQLHKKRFTLFPLKRLNVTQSCLLVFLYQVSVTTGKKHFTSVRFTIINLNERMTHVHSFIERKSPLVFEFPERLLQ